MNAPLIRQQQLDIEHLNRILMDYRSSFQQVKTHLASMTAERDEAVKQLHEQLATARKAGWEEAIFFIDHRSNDEDLIQAMREQAKKVQP